jgi:hypothetical protein
MRCPTAEKQETIRLVEGKRLGAKPTLDRLGIPLSTFYRWYDRFLESGSQAVSGRSPSPGLVWNRIPDDVGAMVTDKAFDNPELSPRELESVRYHPTQPELTSKLARSDPSIS